MSWKVPKSALAPTNKVPSFLASVNCTVSPDGRSIATLSSSVITIRSAEDLSITNTVSLPGDLAGPISAFLWSPSSSKLLISAADQIVVVSPSGSSFHAVVRNPLATSGRPSTVKFGATDTEIFVCATSGLKLVAFDLSTSKAVEISNPKFHHPATFSRGYAVRSEGGHLALLTRAAGKDSVSIHHPVTRQVQRSWHPELVDAQGMLWTPDGAWILLWESPAHGRRILLYTPDGQLFRSIEASSLSQNGDADLEPGIRLCQLSQDGVLCAVCDHSRTVVLLSTNTWRQVMRLVHPTTIVPLDTVQVWQEQLDPAAESPRMQRFQRATQMVSPSVAPSEAKSSTDTKPGSSMVAFDASAALLATRLDESPSTVWIWDVAAGELRAVLLFHSNVNFQWHPSIRELLLIRCLNESHHGVSFVWDPLMNGPTSIFLKEYLPDAKLDGKAQVAWVEGQVESPALLLSNTSHYVLLLVAENDHVPVGWPQRNGSGPGDLSRDQADGFDMSAAVDHDGSSLDDTFAFKKI
ncbi:hypothetical protein S40293_09712 [Stachybotrys chartarum IBT 40293]|nr:hypothetical protein S40293_09712 [Stachybotrys chartarum IBT 40293]